MKRNYLPGSINRVTEIVPLNKGGTDSNTGSGALVNLGFIPSSEVGAPLGPIPISPSTGQIDPGFFNQIFSNSVEINGPVVLDPGAIGTYTIVNFDTRLTYVITAINGTVGVLVNNTFTYTAPGNFNIAAGFEVNGFQYNIALNGFEIPPNAPSIINVVADGEAPFDDIVFQGSLWSSLNVNDSHDSSVFNISLTSDFDVVTWQLGATGFDKTFGLFPNMPSGAVLYVRVRYYGVLGTISAWSPTFVYTVSADLNPQTPVVSSPASNGSVQTLNPNFTVSNFIAKKFGDTHMETEWQAASNSNFTLNAVSISSSTDFLHSWTVALPANESHIFVRVRLKGTSGLYSPWSEIRELWYFLTTNDKPSVVSVAADDNFPGNFIVTYDNLISNGISTVHNSSEWIVAEDSNFTVNAQSYITDFLQGARLYSISLPVTSRSYVRYVRVRYTRDDLTITAWSDTYKLHGLYLYPTEIISPAMNETGTSTVFQAIASDYFSILNSPTDSLLSSDWEVSLTSTFSALEFYSYNKTTLPTKSPEFDGSGATDYWIRTRQHSALGYNLPWSVPTKFTTRASNYAFTEIAFIPFPAVDYSNQVTMSSEGTRLCISSKTNQKIYNLTPLGVTLELAVTGSPNDGYGQMSIDPTGEHACRVLLKNISGVGHLVISLLDYVSPELGWLPTTETTFPLTELSTVNYPGGGKYNYNYYVGYQPNGTWYCIFTYLNEVSGGSPGIAVLYTDGLTIDESPVYQTLGFERCNFHNFSGVTSQLVSYEDIGTGFGIYINDTVGTGKHLITPYEHGGINDYGMTEPQKCIGCSADGKYLAYFNFDRNGVVVLG